MCNNLHVFLEELTLIMLTVQMFCVFDFIIAVVFSLLQSMSK